MIARLGKNRAVLLRNAAGIELALVLMAVVLASSFGTPFANSVKDSIAAVVAVAMGLQNAVARRLAVPDLTTTVLTMTLTGLAADLRARNQAVVVRRLPAVGTMLGGAVAGALLVLHVRPSAALGVAAALLALVAAFSTVVARDPADWQSHR